MIEDFQHLQTSFSHLTTTIGLTPGSADAPKVEQHKRMLAVSGLHSLATGHHWTVEIVRCNAWLYPSRFLRPREYSVVYNIDYANPLELNFSICFPLHLGSDVTEEVAQILFPSPAWQHQPCNYSPYSMAAVRVNPDIPPDIALWMCMDGVIMLRTHVKSRDYIHTGTRSIRSFLVPAWKTAPTLSPRIRDHIPA